MMYHYPVELSLWEKINHYALHTATGFAFVYHFFVDGTFLKFFAIELFGVFISLLMFLGLIGTSAKFDVGVFGGDVTILIDSLDIAFENLDTGLQPTFLLHLEEELFGSSHSDLTNAEESLLRAWFYEKYHTSLSTNNGVSRYVSIEHSVLDDAASDPLTLTFPALEDETYSASSYVEILSQLGLLDD